jgi:HEAT repeat protein
MSKKMKLILGITALGICITVGLIVYSIPQERLDPNTLALRQTLRQAVSDAKKGNRDKIFSLINSIGRDKAYASEYLVPDYLSFLKNSDGQVQWLGAMGLYKVNNSKGTKALFEYLKAKDLRNLEEQTKNRKLEGIQYMGQIQASMMAITALGESGDKSAIPLLKSLQGVNDLQFEMGGRPVEEALIKLGAVDGLMNIPPDADKEKIDRASSAVREMRDPNKVPELIATVKDSKIADAIRSSAIAALAETNPDGIVANLFVDIMDEPNYSKSLRSTAAMNGGKTMAPILENTLLTYAQDSNSDIRQYAFMGLVFGMPEKYLDLWFEKIMDTKENSEFRKSIANIRFYMNNSLLKERRTQLFDCLHAIDENNHPIDAIRVTIWELINSLYGEEPSVTLTTRDSRVTDSIRSILNRKIMKENYRLRFGERQQRIEEEIQRIITVYDNNSNEGEIK